MLVTRLLIAFLAGTLGAAALSLLLLRPQQPAPFARAELRHAEALADAERHLSPPYGALVFAAPAALVLLRGRRRR